MELKAILEAIQSTCDGKQGSDEVQVSAELLLAAEKELKDKAQMARDLEMARDEASMKPSVARKLNEKIRGLEAELEELRSNKKVKELEKKVQVLEHDLKQSYTTKNFTLKSGLLELEKRYRAHMNVDPTMAAFWDDITVLLDEKKERETPAHPRVPRGTAPSSAAAVGGGIGGFRTPRVSASSTATPAPSAPAAASTPAEHQAGAEGAAPSSSQAPESPSSTSKAAVLEKAPSAGGIASHVEAFNTIISEEAASAAASLPSDMGSGKQQDTGEMVVRQGAGFRVMRPAGAPEPQADVTAGTGAGTAAAAAAAGPAGGQQQGVQVLAQDFANRWKDVSFNALPASQDTVLGAATAALQQPPAATALEQQSEVVTSSLQALLEYFSSLAAAGSSLPQPPPLPGSSTADRSRGPAGEVDAASLWEQDLQQLLQSAQQLQQQLQPSKPYVPLQQQEATAASLLESVSQMQAVLQSSSGIGGTDAAQQEAAAAAEQLASLKQALLQLQRCQRRSVSEAGGQQLLMSVFGEFLEQLERQGVLAPGAAAAAVAAAAAASADAQQPALLGLLQSFLQANPQVPQVLAVQLADAVPADQQQQQQELQAETSTSAVQAVADAEHREVLCEPLPRPSDHVETQTETGPSDHAETQTEAAAGPSDHAETQTDALARPSDHAETQTEQVQPSISHVSTQAAAESVAASIQTSPPSPVAASVQAELRPEVSDAGAQVDLPPAVAGGADTQADDAGAAGSSSSSVPTAELPKLDQDARQGSGIIYSASGSELSVGKAAVGQQLDILHRIERSRAGSGVPVEGDEEAAAAAAAAVVEVKPEELQDLDAVAKELGQLRADNVEITANLQVTQSLVDHLNTNLKAAIDKADDAEAEAVQVKQQLEATAASLKQLQSEHAEVTHVLINAKVELAEKKGELLKLVRDLKRAITNSGNAAGVVEELQNILAVVPSDEDMEIPASPAANRAGNNFDAARQAGLAGLAAGFGQMREALGGLGAALPAAAGRAKSGRIGDGVGAGGQQPAAAGVGTSEGQPGSTGPVGRTASDADKV